MVHIDAGQWILSALAAILVGMSKTGLPGLGILVVTLLAQAFGGWNSVGIMLPMLVFADVFAVAWYKRHAQWPVLLKLLPWVLAGLVLGSFALRYFGQSDRTKALMNPIIAVLVLAMLALHLLEGRLGPHLTPRSPFGVASSGAMAGFTTTVSNAAGPIMTIFLMAQRTSKEQFMGTIAWFFFLVNLTKVPVYATQGLLTRHSLLIDVLLAPLIIIGVFSGKWLLTRVPQRVFESVVLVLAAVGAMQLFFSR